MSSLNRAMTICLLLGLFACGKEVPLGSRAGGPPDASSVSDDAPGIDLATADLDSQPQNACTAAGGRCISLGAVCNTPGDPLLMRACGDPAALRCCVEVRGVRDGSVDLLIGGTDPSRCPDQPGTGGAAGAGGAGGGGRCGDAGADTSAGQ
ncbi:MAG TPA: hypothetical protein VNO55_11905 [Polyangia bacterium]|nr:hypothetical protein [Polyangia bacterium]